MEEWNAQIALLKAKADKGKGEVKIEYYKTIEALQHKRDKAGTWAEVNTVFHDAISKFK